MTFFNEYKDLKSFFVFFSLLLFGSVSSAQNQYSIDSLIHWSKEIYNANPDSSYSLCCDAEDEAKIQNSVEHIGEIALCKSRYYLLVTDYENAGKEISTAIQFYFQKKDFVNLSRTYSLKSILLERIGETEESNRMLHKAYQISKTHGDRDGEINRLTNMTSNFVQQNNADSAYFYLLKLLELDSDIKGQSRYYLQQNLGMYYQLIEDDTKAIYYFLKAKQICDEYKMIDSQATLLVLLAHSYRSLDMLKDAEKYALESYNLSVLHGLIFEERDAVLEIVEIYEAQGNFTKAFEFQNVLFDVDQRINQIEKIQKVKENEYYLNLAEKEKVIAQNKISIQTEKLNATKAESKNLILYFVVAIVLIVLVFTVFVYSKTKKLNHTIQLSKIILEEKNREIIDSITYAKRIQDAILPPKRLVQSLFKEVFVFYRPKDIVAGDFYWFEKINDSIYFAVADCTGHGVPGAMVSVICHSALSRSVKEFGLRNPAEILKNTSELVRETFIKSDKEVKDGMDIALCELDLKTNRLNFSGANRPAWIIRSSMSVFAIESAACSIFVSDNRQLMELRGDKQPIGHFATSSDFRLQTIQLNAGDCIYLSSDGYVDQFGGEKKKKFKSKVFKEKLLQVQNYSLNEQHQMISSMFDKWKGDLEQTDDVCVVAIKV